MESKNLHTQVQFGRTIQIDELNIIKEAVRYLGYKRSLVSKAHAIDERTMDLVRSSLEELKQVAKVRFVYRIFELSFNEENELTLGTLKIQSKNLYENLKDCRKAIVLGITLGAEVDRLLKRYSVMEVSRAVVFQACAAAFLEEYCDGAECYMKHRIYEEEKQNCDFRPRFSAGYGDFSIYHQGELLRMIDAARMIGLSMTDSCMLTPTKSVTAVIGMREGD